MNRMDARPEEAPSLVDADEMQSGDATRRLRNNSLWSLYTLALFWALSIALHVTRQEVINAWTITFLFSQFALAVLCSWTIRHFADRALDGHIVPRWLLPLTALLAVASVAFAVLGFLPSASSASPVGVALLSPIAGLTVAASLSVSNRTVVSFAVLGTAVIALGTWIAHQMHPVPDADLVAILVNVVALNFVFLAIVPLALKSSFTVLEAVGMQRRLDLLRADLAVAQERLRIARELHDLFGRTLTAVAVKSDLAAELADAGGAPKSAMESRAIHELADNALKEVRATLAGYRVPDLAAEVAGAASLLRSAGASVRVKMLHNCLHSWLGKPQPMWFAIRPRLRRRSASMSCRTGRC